MAMAQTAFVDRMLMDAVSRSEQRFFFGNVESTGESTGFLEKHLVESLIIVKEV